MPTAPVPARVDAGTKQVLLDLVARAEDEGWPTSKACQTLGLQERRLRRWRRRAGTDAGLVDARVVPLRVDAPIAVKRPVVG